MLISKRLPVSLCALIILSLIEVSCLPPGYNDSEATLPKEIPIQEAQVDPAFASTEIINMGLLPFSNAIEYRDSYVISNNLIDKFRGKHPEFNLLSPEEIMAKISSAKLSDDFNVFLGDYMNTGVANPDFLSKVKDVLNVDAILFGEILALGTYSYSEKHVGPITGKVWYEAASENRIGIRLACFRGKDGRKIWEGKHILSSKAGLNTIADNISLIFANYFGRRRY